jgi:hypothetical protein
MRHIKLENNIPIDYTLEQLLIDVPDAVIYKNSQMPHPDLLSNYNVYPLVTTPQPSLNEDETVEESIPEFKDNEWHQTWVIRKMSDIEIQEIIDAKIDISESDSAVETNTGISFLASSEIQETRYNLCKSCSSFTALKTCSECGCIMPLKIKIANVSCPLGKW